MQRVQKELSQWKDELTAVQWTESLKSLATFTCSVVPNPPQALLKYPLGYDDSHQACRDRFSEELAGAANEYHEDRWAQAANLFRQSGADIGSLTDLTVAALSGKSKSFMDASETMAQISKLEEAAFRLLL